MGLLFLHRYSLARTKSGFGSDISNSEKKSQKSKHDPTSDVLSLTANQLFEKGISFFSKKHYTNAAKYFWRALITQPNEEALIQKSYQKFLETYLIRGKLYDAYLFLGKEYISRNEANEGLVFLEMAIKQNSSCVECYHLLAQYSPNHKVSKHSDQSIQNRMNYLIKALEVDPKNPITHHLIANIYFEARHWEESLSYLENSIELSKSQTIGRTAAEDAEAIASAVYLRAYLCKWGGKGERYSQDMRYISSLIRREMNTTMITERDSIKQQSLVHPHMALGYPIDLSLKLAVARYFYFIANAGFDCIYLTLF
jgi:tetratricopeptide (TPR) repeat protein